MIARLSDSGHGRTPRLYAHPAAPFPILLAFLRLGMRAFGGPVAHLGYFHAEFVERRQWVDRAAFAELVTLAQLLPGPTSSQVGVGLGMLRGGLIGGVAAWVGFTAPSAILMVLFAFGAADIAATAMGAGILHALKLAAVAIVAQAVLAMARSLCPDRARATIATAALSLLLIVPGTISQIAAIVIGGLLGEVLCRNGDADTAAGLDIALSRRKGLAFLAAFAALLLLSLLPARPGSFALFEAFYRSGALVFGGGHVVLPLLHDALVAPGWVSDSAFLAGYGAAQAVPGPLFTFAGYLGAIARVGPGGIVGACLALVAIFMPGMLSFMAALPFWRSVSNHSGARSALRGMNAAVVGLLAAALYHPVWTSAVHTRTDVALVGTAFVALTVWRAQPLLVVALLALAGAAASLT